MKALEAGRAWISGSPLNCGLGGRAARQCQSLDNGGFEIVGPAGNPVTTPGGSGGPSAALGWTQLTVVPSGTLTTTLSPPTERPASRRLPQSDAVDLLETSWWC
jgi:hypothetical protein